MHRAVFDRADAMDLVVMAAAVADYTPAERSPQKVPKGGDTLTLALKKTPAILAELGRKRLCLVLPRAIADGDGRAGGRKLGRDRLADSLRRAGDEGGLPLQRGEVRQASSPARGGPPS